MMGTIFVAVLAFALLTIIAITLIELGSRDSCYLRQGRPLRAPFFVVGQKSLPNPCLIRACTRREQKRPSCAYVHRCRKKIESALRPSEFVRF
jgi:hypothetical protein